LTGIVIVTHDSPKTQHELQNVEICVKESSFRQSYDRSTSVIHVGSTHYALYLKFITFIVFLSKIV